MNTLSWHNRSAESLDDSPSPKQSALDTSSYSMKLQQNAQTKREGETMFDFLKRRKRFAIEQRISKHSRYHCQAPTDRSNMLNHTVQEHGAEMSKHKRSSVVDNRDDKMSTLSSKRVTFRQSEAPQTTGRTFFDIVSPFKRKRSKLQSYGSEDITKENVNVNSVKKLKGKEITMQKKSLFGNVDGLANKIDQYAKNASSFRNKAQSLYLETLAVLTEIESNTKDKQLRRRLDQLRKDSKTADRLFSVVEELDTRQEIEEIKQALAHHLHIIQSQLRKQYETEVELALRSRESTHRQTVADLESRLKKSVKELQALQNRLSKQDIESEEYSFESAKKQQELSRRFEQRTSSLESQVHQLQQENEHLIEELGHASEEIKVLEKQHRTALADKSSLEKCFEIEKEEIASRKETFLLEEMAKLKKQFQSDMDQLTDLYRLKEVELLQKINAQQFTIQEFERKLPSYIKAESFFQEEIKGLKQQLEKHKGQNDQLIRQLHHSNDQACVYWTALKDLKTLSTRLGFFGKFARIFEDINFRDSSFR